ncbi:ankyrin repeat domain-containing protein [Mucilaginibacter daejeonensis]|uniref:ankyrin repeat domain-containing protein n=1 Tax=Mucilaginibacter daejeonensis TaxID=398049 RepID=UPI001D173453|nr:ankyrin repeat domain-containing protein [Mucilaginibacter daejeonensis]UEG52219.1 ankyrin repeat domain-containing protein [Mucilaginibacter daejeonensis]
MGQLEHLITTGDLNALKYLLAQNPALARTAIDDEISPLMLSCYHKKPDATSLLLKYLDQIDIFEAAAAGKFDILAYLVYTNPELVHEYNADGFTPLALACYFGQYEAARYLIYKGADVNQPINGNTGIRPIHLAAAGDQLDIVRMLLEHNVSINTQHDTGTSPLHYAAQNGNLEMLVVLLENGGDVSLRMNDGTLPADLAFNNGHKEIADILSI